MTMHATSHRSPLTPEPARIVLSRAQRSATLSVLMLAGILLLLPWFASGSLDLPMAVTAPWTVLVIAASGVLIYRGRRRCLLRTDDGLVVQHWWTSQTIPWSTIARATATVAYHRLANAGWRDSDRWTIVPAVLTTQGVTLELSSCQVSSSGHRAVRLPSRDVAALRTLESWFTAERVALDDAFRCLVAWAEGEATPDQLDDVANAASRPPLLAPGDDRFPGTHLPTPAPAESAAAVPAPDDRRRPVTVLGVVEPVIAPREVRLLQTLAIGGVGVVVALGGAALSGTWPPDVGLLLWLTTALGVTALVAWRSWTRQITATPEGIRIRSFAGCTLLAWRDIEYATVCVEQVIDGPRSTRTVACPALRVGPVDSTAIHLLRVWSTDGDGGTGPARFRLLSALNTLDDWLVRAGIPTDEGYRALHLWLLGEVARSTCLKSAGLPGHELRPAGEAVRHMARRPLRLEPADATRRLKGAALVVVGLVSAVVSVLAFSSGLVGSGDLARWILIVSALVSFVAIPAGLRLRRADLAVGRTETAP